MPLARACARLRKQCARNTRAHTHNARTLRCRRRTAPSSASRSGLRLQRRKAARGCRRPSPIPRHPRTSHPPAGALARRSCAHRKPPPPQASPAAAAMTVVQITRVRPHGPADAAGAEARDRMLRVDGMDVRARAVRRSARLRSRAARPSIQCAAQVSSLTALAAILQMRRPVRTDAALRRPARAGARACGLTARRARWRASSCSAAAPCRASWTWSSASPMTAMARRAPAASAVALARAARVADESARHRPRSAIAVLRALPRSSGGWKSRAEALGRWTRESSRSAPEHAQCRPRCCGPPACALGRDGNGHTTLSRAACRCV